MAIQRKGLLCLVVILLSVIADYGSSGITLGCFDNDMFIEVGKPYNATDGCNTCVCNRKGPICTRMMCTDGGSAPGIEAKIGCFHNKKFWALGSKFSAGDGCNECTCTLKEVGCTEMGCKPPGMNVGCFDNGNFTEVGKSYMGSDDCNMCICHRKGPLCTRMMCTSGGPVPGIDAKIGCYYNDTFQDLQSTFPAEDGCNKCTCTVDGIECTKKDCVTPRSNEGCDYNGTFHQLGATFPSADGCNTCTCMKQAVSCTKMACVKEGNGCLYGNIFRKLGSSFPSDDGCNTCTCLTSGVGCTKKACLPGKGCFYGDLFRKLGSSFPSDDGCNTCKCLESGVSCTERECLQPGRVVGCFYNEKFTVLGESITVKDKCTCTCGSDGASCQQTCQEKDPATGAKVGCWYGKKFQPLGSNFPHADACNSCMCELEGVRCSRLGCLKSGSTSLRSYFLSLLVALAYSCFVL